MNRKLMVGVAVTVVGAIAIAGGMVGFSLRKPDVIIKVTPSFKLTDEELGFTLEFPSEVTRTTVQDRTTYSSRLLDGKVEKYAEITVSPRSYPSDDEKELASAEENLPEGAVVRRKGRLTLTSTLGECYGMEAEAGNKTIIYYIGSKYVYRLTTSGWYGTENSLVLH